MRSDWEALHTGLMGSIDTARAASVFGRMKAGSQPLLRFDTATAVVRYLTGKDGELEDKDRVLATLAGLVADPSNQGVALTLLILGLWPALDGIYQRRLLALHKSPDALEIEIVDRLTVEVQRFHANRVTRVAATLVRNTERELVRARQRELKLAARMRNMGADDSSISPPVEMFESVFGITSDAADDEAIVVLERWLKETVGDDADLVVGAILKDRQRSQLAWSLGLSPATVRKRLQRALARARRALKSKKCRSHQGPRVAFLDHEDDTKKSA